MASTLVTEPALSRLRVLSPPVYATNIAFRILKIEKQVIDAILRLISSKWYRLSATSERKPGKPGPAVKIFAAAYQKMASFAVRDYQGTVRAAGWCDHQDRTSLGDSARG
jgi:hypothetical protein